MSEEKYFNTYAQNVNNINITKSQVSQPQSYNFQAGGVPLSAENSSLYSFPSNNYMPNPLALNYAAPIINKSSQPGEIVTNTAPSGSMVNVASIVPNMTPDVAKKKCKNFLSTLLKLAVHQPPEVAQNIKILIQGLVDNNVTPDQFTSRLQSELKSSDQPCLTPFLKKSLPYLQLSLCQGEIFIEGIKPPSLQALLMKPANVEQMQSLIAAISTYRNPNVGVPGTPTLSAPTMNSSAPVAAMRPTGPSFFSSAPTSMIPAPSPVPTPQAIPPNPHTAAVALMAAKNAALASKQQQQLFLQNLSLLNPSSGGSNANLALQLQQLQMLQNLSLGLGANQGMTSSSSLPHPPNLNVNINNNQSSLSNNNKINSVAKNQYALAPPNPSVGISKPRLVLPQLAALKPIQLPPLTTALEGRNLQPNVVLTPTTLISTAGGQVVKNLPPNFLLKGPGPSLNHKRVDLGPVHEYPPRSPIRDDDDINDVAAMGGVNLSEEKQRILAGSSDLIGFQIRSCQDETLLNLQALQPRLLSLIQAKGISKIEPEAVSLLSHAVEYRLKVVLSKLSVIAEHRQDVYKMDPKYETVSDVRAQLKFLEEVDSIEKRRKDDEEKEMMFRLAKRTKHEDPDQLKLKQKVKEMQMAQVEEMRQMEANMTALAAIGPRKKKKVEDSTQSSVAGINDATQPNRPRNKRVALRDFLFMLEQERETCRSDFLYKCYLR